MRLRVIWLVLAIGSLMLVSLMLPLALLLRTFAANSAVSGATIRAQFMAPLLATLTAKDLRIYVDRVNQQHPAEPVTIFLPDGLRRGVARAWLLLALVALGLLAMAVFVAAQLTRTLVRPLGDVARAAEQLAQGDLTARAPVDGPPEIRQVSNGLNRLAA